MMDYKDRLSNCVSMQFNISRGSKCNKHNMSSDILPLKALVYIDIDIKGDFITSNNELALYFLHLLPTLYSQKC